LRGAAGESQQTFATPQAAIQATIEASEHNDTAALLRIFGPEGKDIVESGDPVQDKTDRMEFVDLAHKNGSESGSGQHESDDLFGWD